MSVPRLSAFRSARRLVEHTAPRSLWIGALVVIGFALGGSGCSGGSDSNAADGNLVCADGTTTSGRLCDGVSDCADGSDETRCDPSCVAELPESQLCDGVEDCDFGADELHCTDSECQFPASARCDGVDDCGNGDDEADCQPGFDASIYKDRRVFGDAPVSVVLDGLDPSEASVAYNGLRLESFVRDGLLTFQMPMVAPGPASIAIGGGTSGRVDLDVTVQQSPEILDADETVARFRTEIGEILPATEVAFSALDNYEIPDELLVATEYVPTFVEETLPLLPAEEVKFVADQVTKTVVLMGSEYDPTKSLRLTKGGGPTFCEETRADVVDYAERVRAGVNVIASNLRAYQTRGSLSDNARNVALSIAYIYWVDLLGTALNAYNAYVENCATHSLLLVDGPNVERLVEIDSGEQYYPVVARKIALDAPAIILAMRSCKRALDDVVANLGSVLGVDSALDFGSLLRTDWLRPLDADRAEVTLEGDLPAELIHDGDGGVMVTWLEPVNEDSTFAATLKLVDTVRGDSSTQDVVIHVSADEEPPLCAYPGTATAEGIYLVSFSGPELLSQLLFRLHIEGDPQAPGEYFLTLVPLVRDACEDFENPGCHQGVSPRDDAGNPSEATIVGASPDAFSAAFYFVELDDTSYYGAGQNPQPYDVTLELESCVGENYCGVGTLTPQGDPDASIAVEFAAWHSEDPEGGNLPLTPPSSCSEL